MHKLKVLFALSVLLVLSITAGTVSATSYEVNISGTIDSSHPTYKLVFISPPNCMGQSNFTAHYDVIGFQVESAGDYIFTLGSENFFAVIYLYTNSFDPSVPTQNCTAADNTYPYEVIRTLSPGVQYYLVITDETTPQNGGFYNIVGEGPGHIILDSEVTPPDDGSEPIDPPGESPCRYQMAAGSALMSLPAATTAYFAPDFGSATTFSVPAGQWYVTDTSGEFSEVWITCRANPVWVPTSAFG